MKNVLVLVFLTLILSVGLVPATVGQSPEEEVLALTRELLENIYVHPSAQFYADHVDPEVTAYEGTPTRVDGIDYHLFALSQLARAREGNARARNLELLNPKVQLFGDVAIVTATSQVTGVREGELENSYLHETRIWVRGDDGWKLVHFHKSPLPEMEDD